MIDAGTEPEDRLQIRVALEVAGLRLPGKAVVDLLDGAGVRPDAEIDRRIVCRQIAAPSRHFRRRIAGAVVKDDDAHVRTAAVSTASRLKAAAISALV